MRRTLAIAMAVGLLLLGGCDRQRPHPAAPPPASNPASTGQADPRQAGPQGADASDVDGLLDQVDQQLSNDAQPAEDED